MVIDMTNEVEDKISDILSRLLIPVTNDYGFLKEVILHNTCISLGQKVRIIKRISEYWGWRDIEFGHFNALLDLRNAFAHTSTNRFQLVIWKDSTTGMASSMGSEMVVERKHKSHWREQERGEAFDEFKELHAKCMNSLSELFNRILAKSPEVCRLSIGSIEIEETTEGRRPTCGS